jgi:hypothetical protein
MLIRSGRIEIDEFGYTCKMGTSKKRENTKGRKNTRDVAILQFIDFPNYWGPFTFVKRWLLT